MNRSPSDAHGILHAGEAEIKHFLGTRPPELKKPPPTYSNAPILGGSPPSAPTAAAAAAAVQPTSQPTVRTCLLPPHISYADAAEICTDNLQSTSTSVQMPVPPAVPAGTTSYPVLGEPLPDIFGTSTSFLSNKPIPPSPVRAAQSLPSNDPASSGPGGSLASNGSLVNRENPEQVTDDEAASAASETSPEGKPQISDAEQRFSAAVVGHPVLGMMPCWFCNFSCCQLSGILSASCFDSGLGVVNALTAV